MRMVVGLQMSPATSAARMSILRAPSTGGRGPHHGSMALKCESALGDRVSGKRAGVRAAALVVPACESVFEVAIDALVETHDLGWHACGSSVSLEFGVRNVVGGKQPTVVEGRLVVDQPEVAEVLPRLPRLTDRVCARLSNVLLRC